MIRETQEQFKEEAEEYREKFEDNCEMVRRFDEILTFKASKVSLEDRVNELNGIIDDRIRFVQRLIKENRNEIAIQL